MLSSAILHILHQSNQALPITAICQRLKRFFPDAIPSQVSLRTATIESVLQLCYFGFIVYDHRKCGYKLLT
uniref:Winged helix Storkhead-box1 domain-containing protein n=1 Tax=Anopheles funestus TaxID=62324 RepID=A0A182S374_ANOFN